MKPVKCSRVSTRVRGVSAKVTGLWARRSRVEKILSGVVAVASFIGAVQVITGFLGGLFRSGTPALRVALITNVADFAAETPYVPQFLLTRSPRRSDVPPDDEGQSATAREGRWAWAHRLGAVDADNTLVRVVFTRIGVSPVEVNGIEVADLKCKDLLRGALLTYESRLIAHRIGVANETQPLSGSKYFLIHLDGPPGYAGISLSQPEHGAANAHYIARDGKVGRSPFPISIGLGEEASVDVLGLAGIDDCTWKLRVLWSSEGSTNQTVVPSGTPLQTTAVGSQPGEAVGVTYYTRGYDTWQKASGDEWENKGVGDDEEPPGHK